MLRPRRSVLRRAGLGAVVVPLVVAVGLTACSRPPAEEPRQPVPPVSATAETVSLAAAPAAQKWSYTPPNPGPDQRLRGPIAGDSRHVLMARFVDPGRPREAFKQVVDVVDATTGVARHVVEIGFDVDSCAVAGNGRTALCAERDLAGRFAVIDLETGALTPVADGIPGSSVVDATDDTYLVVGLPAGSEAGTRVRVLGADGGTVWDATVRGVQLLPGAGVVATRSASDSGRTTVEAYALDDGRKVLSRTFDVARPTVAGYAGGLVLDDGRRAEIYDSRGRTVAAAPEGWRAMSSTALLATSNGRVPSVPVLIHADRPEVAAFSPNDGAQLWSRALPDAADRCGRAEGVQGVGTKVIVSLPVQDAGACADPAAANETFDAYTGEPGPRFRFGPKDQGVAVGTDGTRVAVATGSLPRTLAVWGQGPQPLWSREYRDRFGGMVSVRSFGDGIYADTQRVL